MVPRWHLAVSGVGPCDDFSAGCGPRPVLDGGELAMASAVNRGGHVQLLLGAYVLGGLTAPQEAAVRAHLEHCARCRAEHDELAVVPSWLDLLTPENLSDDPEGAPDGP